MMLLRRLELWAQKYPDKSLVVQIDKDLSITKSITVSSLLRRVQRFAYTLRQYNGKCLLLLFLPDEAIDFLVAFLACLYAGVIAVPLIPPSNVRDCKKMQYVIQDCNAQGILTSVAYYCTSWYLFPRERWPTMHIETTYSCCGIMKAPCVHEVAFLQYTSGSTSNPKGVSISHQALDANLEWSRGFLTERYKGNKICSVTWVPFYHDYGLTSLLNAVYSVDLGSIMCMSPLTFIKHPLSWLKALSKFKATHTQGPNFAYSHCVKHARIYPDQVKDIDLSNMRQFSMGGEMVRYATIQSFCDTFGVNPENMDPSYGMAEMVCGFMHASMVRCIQVQLDGNKVVVCKDKSAVYVSVGKPGPAQRLLIVDANDEAVGEDTVGEIMLHGPSMMSGYYHKAPNFFTVDGVSFVRSGDLGFLHDGHLYVCGRKKAVIIVNGRNVFAADVEHVVLETCGQYLRAGAIAAVAVDDGAEEQLCIVAEVKMSSYLNASSRLVIHSCIRRAVFTSMHLTVHKICLLAKHSLEKTSSGKLQRYKYKQYFDNY